MQTQIIKIADMDSLVVSTTVPIGLAIKYSETGVKWMSHKIIEINKLPELLTYIEEQESLAVKVEYLDAFEVHDDRGKKEEFRFKMLKEAEDHGRVDFNNAYMFGWLEKKSRNWTEYLKVLWGGSPKWKKKYFVLTNIGMIVYADDKSKKPQKVM